MIAGLSPFALAVPAEAAGKGKAVARCTTAKGTVLRQAAGPGKPWKVLTKNGRVFAGDLLLGLHGARLASRNGAVRLDFLADLDHVSPFPIIESAVVLHDSRDADLDVTLDRGRIDLVNRKAQGAARVRVHVWKDSWDLTLDTPGAAVALELYARWPAGTHFDPKAGSKDKPTADLAILVLKGQVHLRHGVQEHYMTAPPGPAMIEWDSVHGQDDTPERLEHLPEWAEPGAMDTPTARAKKQVGRRFRKALVAKGLDAALRQFLNSDNPGDRRLAVFAMGATDNLNGLGKALREAKHPDVWENGVVALRHWVGRAPGYDQLLYQGLVRNAKFDPVDAQTVVQLLHGFSRDERKRPELYQMLLDYLDHDRLAVRGLAYWHLSRLVPEGKALGYNPTDPKAKREAAIARWRKLIPEGKVPAPPRPDGKKE
jgi:hypothetical protein